MHLGSKTEHNFIRTIIENQTRLDSRPFDKTRTTSLTNLNCFGFEKSYKIKQGLNDLDILISFEENDFLLNHFNDSLPVKTFPNLSINFDLKFDYSKYLETFFKNTKISLKINVNVVNDDGNLVGLVINFLHDYFSKIEIPSLKNFGKYEIQSYEMPILYSFALFNEEIICDPTNLEINSSDAVVYVLIENKKICEFIFENGSVDLEGLNRIKKKIENFLLQNK